MSQPLDNEYHFSEEVVKKQNMDHRSPSFSMWPAQEFISEFIAPNHQLEDQQYLTNRTAPYPLDQQLDDAHSMNIHLELMTDCYIERETVSTHYGTVSDFPQHNLRDQRFSCFSTDESHMSSSHPRNHRLHSDSKFSPVRNVERHAEFSDEVLFYTHVDSIS